MYVARAHPLVIPDRIYTNTLVERNRKFVREKTSINNDKRKGKGQWFGLGPAHPEPRPPAQQPPEPATGASFLFLYFLKTFFTKIYFQFHNLQFYTPTARQGGGRGPATLQEGSRDLYVNKKILFARMPLAGACRPPAGRQAPCRHSTGRQGGSRLPHPRKIVAVGH